MVYHHHTVIFSNHHKLYKTLYIILLQLLHSVHPSDTTAA